MKYQEFQCLKCEKILVVGKNSLKCTNCKSRWKIEDDVPNFSSNSVYWGEITRKEMISVNLQLKRGEYWKDALKKVIGKKPRKQFPEPYSFATDLSRANWKFLLFLDKNSKVLDIGAGLGTVSEIMAHYYSEVVSVEPIRERAFFCKTRLQQEGLKNVKVINANALQLPFPENSFDLVIMNGVLEWVALYSKQNPKKVQEQVLSNVLKVLKPNGYLYIGIENRLSYRHFLGHYDPHVELVFITLMPRFLANVYSRVFTGTPYKTYIYSYKGYTKLLKRTGYKEVEIYNVLPDYNAPTYIIPVQSNGLYDYVVNQFVGTQTGFLNSIGRVICRALLKLDMVKYFLPAYIIIARK